MNATKINEAVSRRKGKAVSDYYAALRAARGELDDATADRIAAMGEAAGFGPDEIQKHLALLDRAASLNERASQLPKALKKHKAAVDAAKRAESQLESTIGPLEQACATAAAEAGFAERELAAAREATNSLVGLVRDNAELLSEFKSIPAVANALADEAKRADAAKAEREFDRRRQAAAARVQQSAQLCDRIERGSWPEDVAWERGGVMFDVGRAQKSLADGSALRQAKEQLADAEKALKAIDAEGAK